MDTLTQIAKTFLILMVISIAGYLIMLIWNRVAHGKGYEMSFTKVAVLHCDYPRCPVTFRVESLHKINETRKTAHKNGWLYIVATISENGYSAAMDVCPTHSGEIWQP